MPVDLLNNLQRLSRIPQFSSRRCMPIHVPAPHVRSTFSNWLPAGCAVTHHCMSQQKRLAAPAKRLLHWFSIQSPIVWFLFPSSCLQEFKKKPPEIKGRFQFCGLESGYARTCSKCNGNRYGGKTGGRAKTKRASPSFASPSFPLESHFTAPSSTYTTCKSVSQRRRQGSGSRTNRTGRKKRKAHPGRLAARTAEMTEPVQRAQADTRFVVQVSSSSSSRRRSFQKPAQLVVASALSRAGRGTARGEVLQAS